jgi:hypothetical protein
MPNCDNFVSKLAFLGDTMLHECGSKESDIVVVTKRVDTSTRRGVATVNFQTLLPRIRQFNAAKVVLILFVVVVVVLQALRTAVELPFVVIEDRINGAPVKELQSTVIIDFL